MKKILAFIMLAGLASCSTTKPTIQYVYITAPKAEVVEPKTNPVTVKSVKWKVITKVELEQILVDLEKNPDPNFTLFALTPSDFQALSTNLVDIKRYIAEEKQVIYFYRKYNSVDKKS
jgi:hypothetical protein